jgi:XTP/dITP diphosphohydrolase
LKARHGIFAVMHQILLCTANPGKIAELNALLPPDIRVLSLKDAGITDGLPETGDTIQANALQKAAYAFERTGLPCVADDSGLEVDALDGAPGVDTAFYGGPSKDAGANMSRLLRELEGVQDRSARFRTVIAFVDGTTRGTFEGIIRGSITTEPLGSGGFGYDPVFVPEGHSRTFAQMDPAEKNAISHRAQAVRKFISFLRMHRP